jgi:hypothetical protein
MFESPANKFFQDILSDLLGGFLADMPPPLTFLLSPPWMLPGYHHLAFGD